jgi:hypothetical protein
LGEISAANTKNEQHENAKADRLPMDDTQVCVKKSVMAALLHGFLIFCAVSPAPTFQGFIGGSGSPSWMRPAGLPG